jgi:hypothetical protein
VILSPDISSKYFDSIGAMLQEKKIELKHELPPYSTTKHYKRKFAVCLQNENKIV